MRQISSSVDLIRLESVASITSDSALVVTPPSSSAALVPFARQHSASIDLRHQDRVHHHEHHGSGAGRSPDSAHGGANANASAPNEGVDELEAAAAHAFRYLQAPAVGVDSREANLFVLARPDGIAITRAQSGTTPQRRVSVFTGIPTVHISATPTENQQPLMATVSCSTKPNPDRVSAIFSTCCFSSQFCV